MSMNIGAVYFFLLFSGAFGSSWKKHSSKPVVASTVPYPNGIRRWVWKQIAVGNILKRCTTRWANSLRGNIWPTYIPLVNHYKERYSKCLHRMEINWPDAPLLAVETDAERVMLNAYFSLVNDLPGIFDSAHHTPRVVIAIDEAHMPSKKNTFQPMAILCRAISTYSRSRLTSYPIWVVFASTTSRVPADFTFPHYHREFPPATLPVSLLWILGRSLFSSFPERTM